jgi:hypothetical protein
MIYNTHKIKDRGTIAQLTAVQLMAPIMLLVFMPMVDAQCIGFL